MQHGQKLNGKVEGLLKRLGFELSAVPEPHLCCGSAGTYSVLQPTLSKALRRRKLDALESGQPDLIATANIGCWSHLSPATDVRVLHWVEMIDELKRVADASEQLQ